MTDSRPAKLTLQEHRIVAANLKQINRALHRLLVDVIKERKVRYLDSADQRLVTLRRLLDDIYCRSRSAPSPYYYGRVEKIPKVNALGAPGFIEGWIQEPLRIVGPLLENRRDVSQRVLQVFMRLECEIDCLRHNLQHDLLATL